jgi:CTP:molybdopterin cytidylyltransferase MocA
VRVNPALVILAAGESARLGACKALVSLSPHSPLALLLDAGAELYASRAAAPNSSPPAALVITGAHRAEIESAAPPGVECVWNPRWSEGRTGGIALAAALRPGCDLVLAPVDVPLVPRAVFAALVRAWESRGAPARGWLAPRCRAADASFRYGHPIVLGRALAAEIAALAPDAPLRVLRERADPLGALDVEDLSVLDDLDTPEDLARLRLRCAR